MPTIHAGTAGFSRPRGRYAAKLKFVELDLRAPAPAPRTLARWRAEVGATFAFAVVAPPTLWGDKDFPLRDAAGTAAQIDWLRSLAKPIAPRALVLRTPNTIRPGTAALARVWELVEKVRDIAPVIVWEPQGMWTYEEAIESAAGHDVVVSVDPLRDEIGSLRVAYVRMRGLGGDRRYHAGRLEEIAEALAGVEEAFVVFETPTGFAEAGKLVSIASGLAASGLTDEDEDDEDEEDEAEGEADGANGAAKGDDDADDDDAYEDAYDDDDDADEDDEEEGDEDDDDEEDDDEDEDDEE